MILFCQTSNNNLFKRMKRMLRMIRFIFFLLFLCMTVGVKADDLSVIKKKYIESILCTNSVLCLQR